MTSRVTIPDSLPVAVRVGASGSVPGAIPTAAPKAPTQTFGVYGRMGTNQRPNSPYSGVVNPEPRGNPDYVGTPVRNPYGVNYGGATGSGSGSVPYSNPTVTTQPLEKLGTIQDYLNRQRSQPLANPAPSTGLSSRLSGASQPSTVAPSVTGSYTPSRTATPYTPLSSRLGGAAPIVPREGRVNAPVSAPTPTSTRAGSGNVRIPLPSLPNLGNRPLSRVAAPVARAINPAVRAIQPVVQQVGSTASRAAAAAAPVTSALGRVASAANRVMPYVAGAMDFAQGVQSGESLAEAAVEAGAATAGGLYGAAQGAAYGAAILAPLGPIGSGFGALGGGIAGFSLGWGTGGTVADRLYGMLFPNPSTPDPTSSPGTVIPPPFYGGQMSVMYIVEASTFVKGWNEVSTASAQIMGPITQIGVWTERLDTFDYYGNPISYYPVKCSAFNAAGDRVDFVGYSGDRTEAESMTQLVLQSASVRRADGQPDTGGNPEPLPGTGILTLSPPTGSPSPIPNGHSGNAPTSTPTGNRDPLAPTAPTTGSPVAPGPSARPNQNASDPSTPPSPGETPTDNGGIPDWLPLIAIPAIAGGALSSPGTGIRRSATSRISTPSTTSSSTSTPPSTGGGTGTGGSSNQNLSCRYDSLGIKGEVVTANSKLDAVNTGLNALNTTASAIQAYMSTQIMGKVTTIDAKLGEQIPGGGIGKVVQNIQSFVKKTWDFLQIDRILSVLTFVSVLHNAYMLSNALTQTLFSAFSNILDATGLDEFLGLVDSDDEEVNVGELVGKLADNFFKGIFGVETVDGIKSTWKKWNRIYQAATNILNSIQSMVFSMVEILETISNYTGRIGNALRKSGTVLQNAFNWMNPNANYQDGRFFRYLNNIQETVEVIDQIASEVVSIQDTAEELFDQKEEFNKAVEDAETAVSNTESAAKTASTPNVTITPQDERRAET